MTGDHDDGLGGARPAPVRRDAHSGLPPISASILLTAPMRVERPAASTTAATRRPFSG